MIFDQEVRLIVNPAIEQVKRLDREIQNLNSANRAIKILVDATEAKKVFASVRASQKELLQQLKIDIKTPTEGFSESKYGPSGWSISKASEDYDAAQKHLAEQVAQLKSAISTLTHYIGRTTSLQNAVATAVRPAAIPKLSAEEVWYGKLNQIGMEASNVTADLHRIHSNLSQANIATDFLSVHDDLKSLERTIERINSELLASTRSAAGLSNISSSRIARPLSEVEVAQTAGASVAASFGMKPAAPTVESSLAPAKQAVDALMSKLRMEMAQLPKQFLSHMDAISSKVKSNLLGIREAYLTASKNTDFAGLRNGLEQVQKEANEAINDLIKLKELGVAQTRMMGRMGEGKTFQGAAIMAQMSSATGQTQSEINRLKALLREVNTLATTVPQRIEKMNLAGREFSNILEAWWNQFGRVAVGFTLVYRAMNAIGMVIGKVKEEIMSSIKATGELAALQAKLAMFYTLGTKGATSFATAFQASASAVMSLSQASINSISTMEELSVALDEVGQAGVFLRRDQMQNFTSLVDFTTLVAKTTGNTTTQLRSELQALMNGNIRANNILVRFMQQSGILTKEEVKNLKEMTNKTEVFNKVLEAVGPTWQEAMGQMAKSNPAIAFQIWEKSLQQVLILSQQLANVQNESKNIFSETFTKHTQVWKDMIAATKPLGDEAPQRVRQLGAMFEVLNGVLDKALWLFEKLILGFAKLTAIYHNNAEGIKLIVKGFLAIEGFKALGWLLASGWTRLLTVLGRVWVAVKGVQAAYSTAGVLGGLKAVVSTTNLWAAGIAAVVIGVATIKRYFDEMNKPQKIDKDIQEQLLRQQNQIRLIKEKYNFYVEENYLRKAHGSYTVETPPFTYTRDKDNMTVDAKALRAWDPVFKFADGVKMKLSQISPEMMRYDNAKDKMVFLPGYGEFTQTLQTMYSTTKERVTGATPTNYSLKDAFMESGKEILSWIQKAGDYFSKQAEGTMKPLSNVEMHHLYGTDSQMLTDWQKTQEDADDAFKKLMRDIGSISTNFIQQVKTGISDSKVSFTEFKALLEPAKSEAKLNIAINQRQIERLQKALSSGIVPEEYKGLPKNLVVGQLKGKITDYQTEIKGLQEFLKTGIADAPKLKQFAMLKDVVGDLNANFMELAKEGLTDSQVSMERYIGIVNSAKQAAKNQIEEVKTSIVRISEILETDAIPAEVKGKDREALRRQLEDKKAYLEQQLKDLQDFVDRRSIELPKIKAFKDFEKQTEAAVKNFKTLVGERGQLIKPQFIQPSLKDISTWDGYRSGLDQYRESLKKFIAEREKALKEFESLGDPRNQEKLAEMREYLKKLKEETYGWKEGIQAALNELANPDKFEYFKNYVTGVFQSVSDAISNFVDTGKFKIRDFINTILKEFLKMQIQLQVIAPMAGFLSSLGIGSNAPTITNPAVTIPTGGPYTEYVAKGGMVDEHVVGVGLKTGKRWEFGERGPEIFHSSEISFSEMAKQATKTKKLAVGGFINEHVIGIGKSGTKWEFGENGPELVHSTRDSLSTILKSISYYIKTANDFTMQNLLSSRNSEAQQINKFIASMDTSKTIERNIVERVKETKEIRDKSTDTKVPPIEVHMHDAPKGTRVETSYTEQGGVRLDAYFENMMAQSMATGKASRVLRGVYGLSPQVVGR